MTNTWMVRAGRVLLTEHYENLDAETRALVPLKRIYWPVG